MVDLLVNIPLKCSCPNDCECSNPGATKTWHHSNCKKPSRINSAGDIFCPDFKVCENCKPYFIKDAFFKCSESKNWKQFRKPTQFLMALAQALQAAEFQLGDDELVQFTTKLNMAVISKWNT